jgi:hypothetical protein
LPPNMMLHPYSHPIAINAHARQCVPGPPQ